MMGEKLGNAALLLVGVLGSFGAVTWYRAKAAAPAYPSASQLISAYHGTPGFRPFVHMVRGNERYVMLDVQPDAGDVVRYVHLQIIEPARTAPIVWTYVRAAADCRQYVGFSDNDGETVEVMLADKPRWGPYELVEGSSQTSAAYAACMYLKRL